jgi:hypothetical protein
MNAALSNGVPFFPKDCPYNGWRGKKRYKNQHAKCQRLFNKVGFSAYHALFVKNVLEAASRRAATVEQGGK